LHQQSNIFRRESKFSCKLSHRGGWCTTHSGKRNAALVGDAGGFVNPFTGEGIYYAQKSGEIVAEAINGSLNQGRCFHETYLQLLRCRTIPESSKITKYFLSFDESRILFPVENPASKV